MRQDSPPSSVLYIRTKRATTSGNPINTPVTLACGPVSLSGLLALGQSRVSGLNVARPWPNKPWLPTVYKAGLALALDFICYVHSPVSLQRTLRSRCALYSVVRIYKFAPSLILYSLLPRPFFAGEEKRPGIYNLLAHAQYIP